MEYQIEKNIPIPKSRQGRKGKYPLDQMKVGESFFIPTESKDIAVGVAQRLRSTTGQRRVRKEEFYSVLLVEGGVRCWRVK